MRISRRTAVNYLTRFGVAGVFLVAAVMKLLDVESFAERVSEFGIVFDSFVQPAAWSVILAELFAGLTLATALRGGLTSAVTMLLIFIGVMMYGIALGLDIDCGCFGTEVQIGLTKQLLVDFGLLALCGIIYATNPRGNASTSSQSN